MLLNQNFYCPWPYQAQPGFARLLIVIISVLNYILQSIFSSDIFQEISTLYIHKVFFIRPLVGPVNVKGKKENEQEEAEAEKKEEVEKKEE